MKSWLVTGAAGFIGSNLAQTLLDRGDRVTGIDNFSTGRQINIDRLKKHGGDRFQFVEGDIRDTEIVGNALAGIDCIVHLAAQVSVQKSIDNPVETDAINVGGFVSLIDSAVKAGILKVIYASSCAVYGDNPKLPLDEGEYPRPMSPYAVSKYANELYARVLADLHPKIQLVGLRFFNIFGPWQDAMGGYAAVIPRWIALLSGGEQATVFGDGTATRDFCHIDNVSAAIIRIGERTEPLSHGVFNIGTGVRTSLLELHSTLFNSIEAAGGSVAHRNADHQPWKAGDILHSVASVERAHEAFGYRAEVSLADGIRHMLAEEYGLSAERKSA